MMSKPAPQGAPGSAGNSLRELRPQLAERVAYHEVLAEAHATRAARVTLMDLVRFILVGCYLFLVFLLLLCTRRIRPGFSVRRFLRRIFFSVRRPVTLSNIQHESGHCYVVPVNPRIPSDAESFSRVQVYENGVPLPAPHTVHDTIRRDGHG